MTMSCNRNAHACCSSRHAHMNSSDAAGHRRSSAQSDLEYVRTCESARRVGAYHIPFPRGARHVSPDRGEQHSIAPRPGGRRATSQRMKQPRNAAVRTATCPLSHVASNIAEHRRRLRRRAASDRRGLIAGTIIPSSSCSTPALRRSRAMLNRNPHWR